MEAFFMEALFLWRHCFYGGIVSMEAFFYGGIFLWRHFFYGGIVSGEWIIKFIYLIITNELSNK